MASGIVRYVGTEAFLAGYHRAARLADGRLLVTTSRATDLFGLDDPKPTRAGDMIEKRDLPGIVTLADGRVLAAGGYASAAGKTSILSSCEVFDPANGAWRPAPPMATPRMNHVLLRVGERVLAIGGQNAMAARGDGLDSVEAWTPGDEEWTPLPKLPRACEHPGAAVLADGTVLVVDGGAWIWDPSNESWRASVGGPARCRVAVAALAKGGAIVAGGENEKLRDVANVDVLSPDGRWAAGPPLRESRDKASAIELPGGRVVVAGGGGTRWTTPDTSMLYEWEADYRRASNEYEDRYRDLEEAAVLENGAWTPSWPGKMYSLQMLPLDETRVFVAHLGGCGVWTP